MISERASEKCRMFRNLIILTLVAVFVLQGCSKSNKEILAERIANLEAGSNNPGKTPDEILKEIKEFEDDYDEIMKLHDKNVTWHKVLGVRYMSKNSFLDAYHAFYKAAELCSDATYWRLAAVCAMKLGNQTPASDDLKKETYYADGEKCYLNALEQDPKHLASLKELGKYYAVTTRNSDKAIPILTRALEISTKDTDVMMDLAQAYYLAQSYDLSVQTYENVISITKSDEIKALALENKRFVNDNYIHAN